MYPQVTCLKILIKDKGVLGKGVWWYIPTFNIEWSQNILVFLFVTSTISKVGLDGLMVPEKWCSLQNMGSMTFLSYHMFKSRINIMLNIGAFGCR